MVYDQHFLERTVFVKKSLTISVKAWFFFYLKVLMNERFRRFQLVVHGQYPWCVGYLQSEFCLFPELIFNKDELSEFWGWMDFFFDSCLGKNLHFDVTKGLKNTDDGGLGVISKQSGNIAESNVNQELFGILEHVSEDFAAILKRVNFPSLFCVKSEQNSFAILFGPLALVNDHRQWPEFSDFSPDTNSDGKLKRYVSKLRIKHHQVTDIFPNHNNNDYNNMTEIKEMIVDIVRYDQYFNLNHEIRIGEQLYANYNNNTVYDAHRAEMITQSLTDFRNSDYINEDTVTNSSGGSLPSDECDSFEEFHLSHIMNDAR
jgi:hypothetical protein